MPDNRPGAAGLIGTELVARAPADGYTLLITDAGHSSLPLIYPKAGFHPTRDFAPVSLVATTPYMLAVHPSIPARSLKELIALARAGPDTLTHASGGTGSLGHLAAELFKQGPGFPSRPIRLVVPWPPGGISDTSARILAQHMSASVGQPVIVDNRAGAGSTIGTDLVAKSSADGYTLLYADVTTTAINATAYPKLAYDTREGSRSRDHGRRLAALSHGAAAVPAKTVQDLVALAKAKPATLNFASAGTGSTLHLAGELFRAASGVEHRARAVQGIGAGDGVDRLGRSPAHLFGVAADPAAYQDRRPARAGDDQADAIERAARRARARRAYPGFRIFIVNGVLAPAGIARDRTERIGTEVAKLPRSWRCRSASKRSAWRPARAPPAELAKFLDTEIGRFGKLIRDTRTRLE